MPPSQSVLGAFYLALELVMSLSNSQDEVSLPETVFLSEVLPCQVIRKTVSGLGSVVMKVY